MSYLGDFNVRILHLFIQHVLELLYDFVNLFQNPAQNPNLQHITGLGSQLPAILRAVHIR